MGNPVTGYRLASQGQVLGLQAEQDDRGQSALFVRGLDQQIYVQHYDIELNPVTGYLLTQQGAVKDFALGESPGSASDLFAIGLDNQVYEQQFDAANNPGGYFLAAPGTVKVV